MPSALATALVGVTDSIAKWFTEKKIKLVTAAADVLHELGVEEAHDMDDLDKEDIEMVSSVLRPEM